VNKSGTSASYISANKKIYIPSKPKKLGMWVHGDGKNHWLRAAVTDSAGKTHTLNFTEQNKLNWYGWKFVQAAIPSGVAYPISLEKIYVAETLSTHKNKGIILFDELVAIYKDSEAVRYFSNVKAAVVHHKKEWTIRFNHEMDPKTVNSSTMYVEDQDGKRLPVQVSLDPTLKVAKVIPPVTGYEKGKLYQLVITKHVRSKKGVSVAKDSYKTFTIQN
jgi:hypothetical protein